MADPNAPLVADPAKARNARITAAILAAAAIATPIAAHFEGFSGKVYYDPAGIPTQGYGETEGIDPTRIWSKDEAMARLRARMANKYGPPIIACVPSFVDHPNAFGAALDASYNAGPAAVCRSAMAKAFNRGDYKAGCAAFAGWYVTTTYRGKPLPAATMRARGWRPAGRHWVKTLGGLVSRRQYESTVCLKDAA